MKLRAFHGDPTIAEKYRRRVEDHRIAGQIIQGLGWIDTESGGRGCGVGCTLNRYDHDAYPDEIGIPVELAFVEDQIHEGLPFVDAELWPGRFLAAPKIGADLSDVWPQFAMWLLSDPAHGVLRHEMSEIERQAIERVVELFQERSQDENSWLAAARCAYAASCKFGSSPMAFPGSSAAFAAFAAAKVNAGDPAYATDLVSRSAFTSETKTSASLRVAFRRMTFNAMADKLIELMVAAPV